MKTSWNSDRLFSKMGGPAAHEWRQLKKKQFQAETGVAWSAHTAHGHLIFKPVLDKKVNPYSDAHFRWAQAVLPHIPEADSMKTIDLITLAKLAGVSILNAVEGCGWLEKHGKIWLDVDRMGAKAYPVKRKEPVASVVAAKEDANA